MKLTGIIIPALVVVLGSGCGGKTPDGINEKILLISSKDGTSVEKRLDIDELISFYGFKIRIASGAVSITDATCSGPECGHTGAISEPGETLRCARNGMVLKIMSKNEQCDAIVY